MVGLIENSFLHVDIGPLFVLSEWNYHHTEKIMFNLEVLIFLNVITLSVKHKGSYGVHVDYQPEIEVIYFDARNTHL